MASLSGKEALATSDEMHNLVPVTGHDLSRYPRATRQNFEVPLDGNAFAAKAEVLKQAGHVQPIRNFMRFAVHFDFHFQDRHKSEKRHTYGIFALRTSGTLCFKR